MQKKVFKHYGYIDIVEQRSHQEHDLVINHRFPMERWETIENHNTITMTEEDIQRKLQLLKKDSSGNHNLLKSRACERCIASGKRGYPMGIKFFYSGGEN